MNTSNLDVYIPVLILASAGILMVGGALFVGHFFVLKIQINSSYNHTSVVKTQLVLHGLTSTFVSTLLFIFIIFDVEGALMFPVAAVFKNLMKLVLAVSPCIHSNFYCRACSGVVYCWKKGDLDWVKSFNVSKKMSQKRGIAK